jgi:tetratricopeptide (TPR) repeat protein
MRLCFLVAAFALISARANAEASSSDKAAAEALFDRGVTLLRAKEYKEACAKLETSQRIEPAVGTLLYLGECYDRLGRTASAWATFREASSLAQASGQAERAKVASQRADKLEPDLAYLTVTVAPEALVPGLVVRRSSEVIKPDLYGVSIPADPGEINIEASAPGYESQSSKTTLSARDRRTVTIPALKAVPGSTPPRDEVKPEPPTSSQSSMALPHESITPEAPPSRSNAGRVVGVVIGGVGLVGVGIGSYFGVRAYQKNRDAKDDYRCSGDVCLDPGGLSLTDEARDQARLSNIAFAAGGGLLALGIVIYAVSPSQSQSGLSVAPSIASNGAGLSVQGGFQ